MKIHLIIVLLACIALHTTARAQFLGGFFNQKGTERKYMLAQIAGYQLYLKQLKDGYRIIDQGFSLASDLKHRELTLHKNYFEALRQPSAAVSSDARIAGILKYRDHIHQLFDRLQLQYCAPYERSHILRVRGLVSEDCRLDLGDLESVVTAGKLSMTDDQRLRRIGLIYSQMQDRYRFSYSFTNSVRQLDRNIKTDLRSVRLVKRLYELP